MKKRISQILSVLFILSVLLCALSSCKIKSDTAPEETEGVEKVKLTSVSDDKYLLVCEEEYDYMSSSLDEFYVYKTDYGYDEFGRLNKKERIESERINQNDHSTESDMNFERINYSDFKYDDSGNVISYMETSSDSEVIIYYFKYDNNKCVSRTVVEDRKKSKITDECTYTYDEKGTVITETETATIEYKEDGTSCKERSTTNYKLYYENDLCIRADVEYNYESTDKNGNTDGLDYETWLEMYEYDSDGNRINKYEYWESWEPKGNNQLELDGKYYYLTNSISYTYKKFGDIKTEKLDFDLGFNDVNEWGNILVRIEPDVSSGFVCEDENGKYVVVMKDNNVFWEFYPTQNQFLTNSLNDNFTFNNSDVSNYNVLSNDRVSVVNSYESYTISIVDKFKAKNIPIFKLQLSSEEYYIPYEYIDTSKDYEFFRSGKTYGNKSYHYYKFYLK